MCMIIKNHFLLAWPKLKKLFNLIISFNTGLNFNLHIKDYDWPLLSWIFLSSVYKTFEITVFRFFDRNVEKQLGLYNPVKL